ncbi:LexA family transcriptional regulator [Pandoraea sp. SD6-2]|uniref:LexA family protein n=1 Tax=Pandoraea sp. SD6-2 TaxID=1286093 RepID=UPI00032EA62E|nr:S24 family peptidase [Pandoraea sp. SD6-2]EON13427.1 prophage repressor [Pandoraea sp. SD6-2]
MNELETQRWRIKRLEDAIEKVADGNRTEFGRRLGYKDGAFIRQLLGGSRPIREKTVNAVEALPGMKGWFSQNRSAVPETAGFQNVEIVKSSGRRVPVISYVQAGLMVEIVDPFSLGGGFEIVEVSIPCSSRTFALRIRGNSMEPRFYEGDLAIIDPELSPKPGQFVVAKNTSEEATFKKYRPRGMDERGNDVFELVPLNEDYPTLHSERDHLHIIGVCIERRENMLK